MTRVEEERDNCLFALALAQKGADEGVVFAMIDKALDALVFAAKEGAVEQERERCWLCWQKRPTITTVEDLPTVYGDALPIKETPCSG